MIDVVSFIFNDTKKQKICMIFQFTHVQIEIIQNIQQVCIQTMKKYIQIFAISRRKRTFSKNIRNRMVKMKSQEETLSEK
jgi:hypothetical protein